MVTEESRKWMEKWTQMMEEGSKDNRKVLYGMVRNKRKNGNVVEKRRKLN